MEGGGIRDWDMEFKMINVVVFGKYKKNVHYSTSIMNVAVCKISLGVHTMSASETSPRVRVLAGPLQELEFRARSALKFQFYIIPSISTNFPLISNTFNYSQRYQYILHLQLHPIFSLYLTPSTSTNYLLIVIPSTSTNFFRISNTFNFHQVSLYI